MTHAKPNSYVVRIFKNSYNVCFIKIRSKLCNVLLLCLLRIFMKQTLGQVVPPTVTISSLPITLYSLQGFRSVGMGRKRGIERKKKLVRLRSDFCCWLTQRELNRWSQFPPNLQVPAEGLELVILLHTQCTKV